MSTKKVYRKKVKRWKGVKARAMRNNPTPSEKRLWQYIRKEKLGVRFRRQHIILGYIADFYCPKKRLVIEIDGDIHKTRFEEDKLRDVRFNSIGIRTLRLPADMVMGNIDSALKVIGGRIK